jgi:O-antigen ligase/polysaccharide polymerase Wzy-like membrane protein
VTLAAARTSITLLVPAAASSFALLAVQGLRLPAPVALAGVLGPAAFAGLVLWPWAALPVAIVGGTIAAQVLGASGVTALVAVHLALVGAGSAAVVLRRRLDPTWPLRVAAPADSAMALLAVGVVLGCSYGLASGNDPHAVFVAANAFGVIPAYYFLATTTLVSPERLRAAGVLFAVGAAAVAMIGLTQAGRHGGLFSAIALPGALTAAAAARAGATRRLLLALCCLLTLDVLLAAYRTVWLAAAVALVLLVVRGAPRVRRMLLGTLALALVLATTAAVAGGVERRLALVRSGLAEPAGYRLAEAKVGWTAFLEGPLVGQGLGQTELDRFVDGLGLADVGPVYHAFYVTVLANAGLVGLAVLAWAMLPALRRICARRVGAALPFSASLLGFVVAATFAGPSDGHWELGLLAALTLLADRFERQEAHT